MAQIHTKELANIEKKAEEKANQVLKWYEEVDNIYYTIVVDCCKANIDRVNIYANKIMEKTERKFAFAIISPGGKDDICIACFIPGSIKNENVVNWCDEVFANNKPKINVTFGNSHCDIVMYVNIKGNHDKDPDIISSRSVSYLRKNKLIKENDEDDEFVDYSEVAGIEW